MDSALYSQDKESLFSATEPRQYPASEAEAFCSKRIPSKGRESLRGLQHGINGLEHRYLVLAPGTTAHSRRSG
jgi:hypothetical protein